MGINSDKQKSGFAPFLNPQIQAVLWHPQHPCKLFLDDHGNNLDSFRISLESFGSFRGPILHKPVTGQELFFDVFYSKPALVTSPFFAKIARLGSSFLVFIVLEDMGYITLSCKKKSRERSATYSSYFTHLCQQQNIKQRRSPDACLPCASLHTMG